MARAILLQAENAPAAALAGSGRTQLPDLSEVTDAAPWPRYVRCTPFSRALVAPPGTESLDYDLHESQHYLEQVAAKRPIGAPRSRLTRFLFMRWGVAVAVGAVTGLTGAVIDQVVLWLFNFRFWALQQLSDAQQPALVLWAVYVLLATAMGAVAGLLVCYVEPLAAGSGIPEVKCCLNGIDVPRVTAPWTYVAKAAGVLFSVAAGFPIGKEGPMIHSGAILGGVLSRLSARFMDPLDCQPRVEEREMITAGAAAGVAAAFGAPLGGVLFAMEEGSSFWTPRTMLRCFVCTAVSALVLNFFLIGEAGKSLGMNWGELGALGVMTFGIYLPSNSSSYRVWELPLFVVVGLGGGLLGAGFNAINIVLTRWRMRVVGGRGHRRFLEVLVVIVCVSTLFLSVPLAAGKCLIVSFNTTAGSYAMSCSDGSDGAHWGFFTMPSEDSIKVLFHDPDHIDGGLLLGFGALYFLLADWTYGLGVPSGLFVPSLLVGSVFGRLVGQFLHDVVGIEVADPRTYALIGAASALAGMARITISLSVILVEATGNTQWTLPLLFTVTAAKWAGDFFNEGIYDIHIHLKHQPLLAPFPKAGMQQIRVGSVMTSDVTLFEEVVQARSLREALANSAHHGFPIVAPGGRRFVGMASREVLLSALDALASPAPTTPQSQGAQAPAINPEESVEVESRSIDLGPYINRGAYTVREQATLRRAYALFRSLGLRHLPVLDQEGCVVGLLTRKDLILAADGAIA